MAKPRKPQVNEMSGPDGEGPQVPVQLRLPPDLLKRIDAHAAELERRTPGIKFSRSDAIKNLVSVAFDALAKDRPRS